MITFNKISAVHFEVLLYDVKISSIAIHRDYYKIYCQHNTFNLPLKCKTILKDFLVKLYYQDLKFIELAKYSNEENEGFISIKKMEKILNYEHKI